MPAPQQPVECDDHLARFLEDVRGTMHRRLSATSLAGLAEGLAAILGNGKMLRARLVHRVGSAAGLPTEARLLIAAAVELVHAGSLLHDDVIDGAALRRGAPAFWVERGVPAAILLGDLLFFLALELLQETDGGRLVPVMVRIAGEICDGESEQELVLRGRPSSWEQCVSIARRKTGALFAFAAQASGGTDAKLQDALRKAGYAIGTAYQLSDDILDATGSPAAAGKTLGSDRANGKPTAVTAALPEGTTAVQYIEDLCASAPRELAPWPAVRQAWEEYTEKDFAPALRRNLDRLAACPAPPR